MRIEDIDLVRCTPALEKQMLEDLQWLGFDWDEAPLRQSDRLKLYEDAIGKLRHLGLVYPAFMSRGEIKRSVQDQQRLGKVWPHDPDGTAHYPDRDRLLDEKTRAKYLADGRPHALRLDMAAALAHVGEPLIWDETGAGPMGESGKVVAHPAQWGDIVLSGKDTPASYHLSSVVDDACSKITHIVRGRDLFWATSVHRLLQALLGYKAPQYHHHDLVLDDTGKKLSKSNRDTSLAELRQRGVTPDDIRKMVGI